MTKKELLLKSFERLHKHISEEKEKNNKENGDYSKCNMYLREMEKLKEEASSLTRDGFFKELKRIDSIPGGLYSSAEVPTKLAEIKLQLEKIVDYLEIDIEPSSLQGEGVTPTTQIVINQNIQQSQINTQLVSMDSNQLIEQINTLDIRISEKETAKENLEKLKDELSKPVPNKELIKKILEWAIDFSKNHGINIILAILPKILEHWDKIVS